MAVCIPKHIACGWYTENDIGFIPGTVACTILIVSEFKSRVNVGGSFFRSKDSSLAANNIQISCTLQADDNNPPTGDPANWRDAVVGDQAAGRLAGIKIIVKDDNITEGPYYAQQTYDTIDEEWSSGISSMRTTLNSTSFLIDMPAQDDKTNWLASTDDADHLSEFTFTSGTFTGGNGAETTSAYLKSIRTGPSYTLIYIDVSENDNDDGNAVTLGETRYWDGFSWLLQDPTNLSCAGSPPVCGSLPAQITDFTAVGGVGKITVNWTPPPNPVDPLPVNSLYRDGISVMVGVVPGFSYSTVGNEATYKVVAENVNGSVDSNTVVARPLVAPTKITNFAASDNVLDAVIITFDVTEAGYPIPEYQLYKQNALVANNVYDGFQYNVPGPDTAQYKMKSVNSAGTTISNTDIGIAYSLPSQILDFVATVNLIESIRFTWSFASGLPTPTYDLYQDGTLLISNVSSGYIAAFPGGTSTFFIRAINDAGSTDSNTDTGIALSAPSQITDFVASDTLSQKIKFTWTNSIGVPTPIQDLYMDGSLLTPDISSGYEYITSPNTSGTFYIIATNSVSSTQSNLDVGTALDAPGTIADFDASDNIVGSIQFTWSNTSGVPTPTYDIYQDGVLFASNVGSGFQQSVPIGTALYYVQAINVSGTTNSNTDSGTAL